MVTSKSHNCIGTKARFENFGNNRQRQELWSRLENGQMQYGLSALPPVALGPFLRSRAINCFSRPWDTNDFPVGPVRGDPAFDPEALLRFWHSSLLSVLANLILPSFQVVFLRDGQLLMRTFSRVLRP